MRQLIRDIEENVREPTMLIQVLPECLPVGIRHPLNHQVQSALRHTDRTHAMVDATWTSQKLNEEKQ